MRGVRRLSCADSDALMRQRDNYVCWAPSIYKSARGLSSVVYDNICLSIYFFFFQAEDGIRDYKVTGVQTCALPIFQGWPGASPASMRCSQATPSRASSLQLVTLTTVAAMPSLANCSAALSTSVRMAPDPSKVTCCVAWPASPKRPNT